MAIFSFGNSYVTINEMNSSILYELQRIHSTYREPEGKESGSSVRILQCSVLLAG